MLDVQSERTLTPQLKRQRRLVQNGAAIQVSWCRESLPKLTQATLMPHPGDAVTAK